MSYTNSVDYKPVNTMASDVLGNLKPLHNDGNLFMDTGIQLPDRKTMSPLVTGEVNKININSSHEDDLKLSTNAKDFDH